MLQNGVIELSRCAAAHLAGCKSPSGKTQTVTRMECCATSRPAISLPPRSNGPFEFVASVRSALFNSTYIDH